MSAIRVAWLLCLTVSLAFSAVTAKAEKVLKIEVRPGVVVRLLTKVPPEATAMVLLFPGGHGKVLVRDNGEHRGLKGNFLIRSRHLFVAAGLASAIFDAPSDRRDKSGLSFTYRSTEEHAGDIGRVVAGLMKTYPNLPVWLVGTSRGSTSVANAAASLPNGSIRGVVLTSAIGMPFRKGGNVLDFDLGNVKVPALVVHHRDDGCVATPLAGANAISSALTGSRDTELLIFYGGKETSEPCKGKSRHGFLGIEEIVVDAIATWIRRH